METIIFEYLSTKPILALIFLSQGLIFYKYLNRYHYSKNDTNGLLSEKEITISRIEDDIDAIKRKVYIFEKNLREYASIHAKTNGRLLNLEKDSNRLYENLQVFNAKILERLSQTK